MYDRDGNGTADLYLQHRWTGAVEVWSRHGSDVIKRELLPLTDVAGALAGAADLDGGGSADLLWADDGVLWATCRPAGRPAKKVEVGRLPASWVVAEVMPRGAGVPTEVLLQDTQTRTLRVWTLDGDGRQAGERPLDYGTHDGTLVVQRARRTPPAPEDPAAAFARELYFEVLGRAADEGGLAHWMAALAAGAARAQVVEAFWNSEEHRGLQVDRLYATYLGRPADPLGRAAWAAALASGLTVAEVAVQLLTSLEARAAHPDDTAFLHNLYRRALGREADVGGLAAFGRALQEGVGRAAVARAVLASEEKLGQSVDALYADYLDRQADAGGRTHWLSGLEGGTLSAEPVAQAFLACDEFFSRAAADPLG